MKKIVVFILTTFMVVSLIGCGKEDLQTYKEAVKKTDEITKGKTMFEIKLDNEFNTEGLSQEKIKKLNYFKTVETENHITFDWTQDKMIVRNYYNFGGMGFDTTIYVNGEDVYMKMPIVEKYISMSDMTGEKADIDNKEKQPDIMNQFYEKVLKSIKSKWTEILNKEDVVSGEKTILDTEDGRVKATHFTIDLTGEQIKTLLNESLDIVSENKDLIKEYIKITNASEENKQDIDLEEVLAELKQKVNQIEIKEFNYNAYIDIDGYIVQENIEFKIRFNDVKPGETEEITFNMNTENWSIEKEQEFNFPKLTEEDILSNENIEQGIPFIFEDIFNSNSEKGDN
ncbi:hypothetical protein [Caldisalinibacter kiritimatiensis]|uniref:Lipoprotein n=1 Tax=Caldisalinibacter kiritimatiensis TaxID=1304284 RepID=R1AR02_9FIRM|nr:hypothetical protein [Caldisalinibacter kiritimatiensis]EOC99562.1 hypothetical protein L21TH_2397 [Caldisalinibacter kiritimatiensis]